MAIGKRSIRTHNQNTEYYKTGVRAQKPGETFDEYYRNLVDMANRRLRRLVEMEKDPLYKGVTNFAYKKAMNDIKGMSEKEMKGFTTVLPKNQDGTIDKRSAHARLNAVKRFLESPTSTRGGINKVFMERAKSINKNLNEGLPEKVYNFTWQELAIFWNSEKAQKESKKYGSSTFMKAISATKEFVNPEDIKNALKTNQQLSDDAIIDEITKKLLKEGKTFKNLIG